MRHIYEYGQKKFFTYSFRNQTHGYFPATESGD